MEERAELFDILYKEQKEKESLKERYDELGIQIRDVLKAIEFNEALLIELKELKTK